MSDHHNNNNNHSKKQDELDSFLTTIESKLRGPFSSLDLAKAVSTTALRNSSSGIKNESGVSNATAAAKDYLHNLSLVMSRTDKVIQCRMLIGLMGLTDKDERSDGAPETSSLTPEIAQILEQTQVGPLHEEWVRTTSGLIQGIMFRDAADNTRGSCRGEEAAKIIASQGEEVSEKIKQYLDHQRKHHADQKEPDLNACFAPYRYSLISTEVLNTIIPEFQIQKANGETSNNGDSQVDMHQNIGHNCHFHVNANADILQVDWKLEEQRAKEEEQHGGTGTAGLAGISGSKKDVNGADPLSGMAKLPPGFRPTKLVNSPKSKASASSKMFMPKAKSSLFNTSAKNRPGAGKTLLRRKGGAQALVSQSSMKQRMATVAGGGAAGVKSATAGLSGAAAGARGAGRFTGKGRSAMAAGRSKMKMIDVEEASDLTKQHQQAHEQLNPRAAKRKRILEAAQRKKMKKTEPAMAPAAAAQPPPVAEPEPEPEPAAPQEPEEWESILLGRSNKMADSDKLRVKQFVEDKYNPTPDQHTYKMKIHEQRGVDPETGREIKETFYLELNYDDLTHLHSKKTKRY